MIAKSLLTQGSNGLYDRYPIPPRSATRAHAHIMVRGDIVGARTRVDVRYKVKDQYGRSFRAIARNVRVN